MFAGPKGPHWFEDEPVVWYLARRHGKADFPSIYLTHDGENRRGAFRLAGLDFRGDTGARESTHYCHRQSRAIPLQS